MSNSLLFAEQDNLSSDPSRFSITEQNGEEEKQKQQQQLDPANTCPTLTLTENCSFLTILKRLGIYWRRILLDKIRLVFTLVFMSMLNITARIACFTRRQTHTSPPSSSASLNSLSISSSTGAFGVSEKRADFIRLELT
ncbi:unnamed protein product [Adineta ricciae]|uniref:Uncharacterized protein n=1 Tax=Adineta ricciae TaxID=249248 RepID=A0A815GE36_ADIRI|nr:unnamed protein product [Adineta ricciae]CAF1337438.1 unnamed protein product [Adineta ricciae]